MILRSQEFSTTTVPENFEELAAFAVQLTKLGRQVIDQFPGDKNVREKSPRDFVTAVDEAVQNRLWQEIRSVFPESYLLGEEACECKCGRTSVCPNELKLEELFLDFDTSDQCRKVAKDSQLVWIIDPIDGTANFIKGIPYYAVSVAVALENRVIAGAVLDVSHDKCYWTWAGGPAMENDQEIGTSSCDDISYAMLSISLPCSPEARETAFRKAQGISERCANIRRLGSAALNICNVASGTLDGYWAGVLNLWDVAAAALVLKQAGGIQEIGRLEGDWKLSYRCCGNQALFQQLDDCLGS